MQQSMRFTQLAVERLAPPKTGRVIIWDRLLPGFGLRISSTGARAWVAKYRVNGRQVMETIATVARLPNVADARQAARKSMAAAGAGNNPVVEKRTAAARTAANSVRVAAERYLAEHCDRNLKPATAREWHRIFEHDVLPRWGSRPLAEISKGDVLEILDAKAARRERQRKGLTNGAGVQANKTLARLRTFFGWCAAHDLCEADPTAGVRKIAREVPRDRVLSDDEIRVFWMATEKAGMPFGHLFRLMLLTGQREGEVVGMRWSELNLSAGIWELPGGRTKNGKPHTVHLNTLAVETIERVPMIDKQDMLFSNTGTTPVSGFSRAKNRLDERMQAALRKELDDDKAEIAPWVLHDLRRTVTTGLARLGIAPHVADRILNHQAGTIRGVAATYNRFQYVDERKAALDAWGRFVEGLVRRAPSNVVPLTAAR